MRKIKTLVGVVEMSETYEKDKDFLRGCLDFLAVYEKDKHFEAYDNRFGMGCLDIKSICER